MKNNKIKILMLLESSFPPDIRVEKEAKSLLEAGYNLSLMCFEDNTGIDKWHGMKLIKIIKSENLFNKLLNRSRIVHQKFYSTIIRLLEKEDYDVIHVHDLRLVPTALKVKTKYTNVKIVVDLHENYPAAVREWSKAMDGLKGFFFKAFNNYKKWYDIEKRVLNKVDKIIAVVDEMKYRIIEQHNIKEKKIKVISNLEDMSFVKDAQLDKVLVDKYNNQFIILYIGGFGVHRGLDTAIKGMSYLKNKNIKLLLVGRGSRKIEADFKNLIEKHGITNHVEIVGWQPFEKVYSYQKLSDICIIPHSSNEHTNNTIPHKLYQYMMVGKPIIVSSCKPLDRVISQSKSGLIFKAGDPEDFAKKVEILYSSSKIREEFIRNGKIYTYEKNNNWNNEANKLIDLYKEL